MASEPAAPPKVVEPSVPLSFDAAFASIIVTPGNSAAIAAVRQLLAGTLPGRRLYLHGPEGCGKTAILEAARRVMPALRVLDLADQATRRNAEFTMRGDVAGLGAGRDDPAASINAEALTSAMMLPIAAPDDDLLALIVDREIVNAGASIDPAARDLLRASDLGPHRRIALARTLAFAAAHSGPARATVTEAVMAGALTAAEKVKAQRIIRVDDVIRLVSKHYLVSRADMLSQRRTANVVRPRQVAMYLAKTVTLRSLPEIGRRFGGRDHTTVLHAVRKIEGLRVESADVAKEMRMLTDLIEGEVRA